MRILDLFCGPGGAGMGYHQAGHEVVGVDIENQPNYPFEFHQSDALDQRVPWHEFDAVHASPPCQLFSAYRRKGYGVGSQALNLIPQTRAILAATGLPYVIENVEGARSELRDPTRLCGSMFNLAVQRHRLFETNWFTGLWPGCNHGIWTPRYPAATNRNRNSRCTVEIGVWRIPLQTQRDAMGVHWDVTLKELSQMIPPAYTREIGERLHLEHGRPRRKAHWARTTPRVLS